MTLKVSVNLRLLTKMTFVFLFLQFTARTIFIIERALSFRGIITTFINGLLWDTCTWLIMAAPLIVLVMIIPLKLHRSIMDSKLSHLIIFITTLIFGFVNICEILFWQEFHSRFNFIAVDYLIYTNEVLSTVRESFNMPLILSSLVALAGVVTYLASFIRFQDPPKTILYRKASIVSCGLAFTAGLIFLVPWLETHEQNFHKDQMARNGIFEFVRAFRSNQIDFKEFYRTVPSAVAQRIYDSKSNQSVAPLFNLTVKKPNVVMIVVESLGAKFIGPLSDNKTTTPFLNDLASKSIFFNNFYATGTRTVRGLEAISLSIPPTPGYAVVKRPDHKGLYSIGHTFKTNGYDPIFLYGGRGFFDNMNSFFAGNSFRVFDQTDFTSAETTFSNAWGVCDEDLFSKAKQKIVDLDPRKPFLLFLLTTSNHRPFTYPPGRIDIPSGESRAGAVKYTDFAIGKFLEDVKDTKWAQNTIFVVVADHSTEGRGRFDLEMSDFHIPLWIYSPALLKPQVISKLGSQIDLVPSLIHLLNLKDDSPFFGRSLFNEHWKDERAFIGNYQYVGYYRDSVLTTLGPNRTVKNFSYDPLTKKQKSITASPFLEEAISYYQIASEKLDSGKYKPAH